MNRSYYIIDKTKKEIVNGYINESQIHGFGIKPQNNIPYEGIEVSHLTLIDSELIKRVLIKKTKRKLNTYLNFLIAIIDDDDTDGEALELVIDDAERYKRIILEKYSKFLEKSYIKSLLRRLNYVEKELKKKLKNVNLYDEMKIGRKR
ncbi:MAG: hypothetical protein IKF82_04255 [Bacilli bacterium]|nr:hypothetical protein [Bacilli bacterium]